MLMCKLLDINSFRDGVPWPKTGATRYLTQLGQVIIALKVLSNTN